MAKIGKGARSIIVKKLDEVLEVAGKKSAKQLDDIATSVRRNADEFTPNPNRVVKDPTYARPSGFRQGVREEVWGNAIEPKTGRVRDPKTGQFMSSDKPWDMGHQPGHEFWKHQQRAEDLGLPRSDFLNQHNMPSHYRPELPLSNRGHSVEGPIDLYLGD